VADPSTTERPGALAALGAHRAVSAGLVLLFAAGAVGYASTRPTSYTAEARLAVSGDSLSAEAVPGFALASQELAANYARYVNNAQQQSSLATSIGAAPGAILEVTASPIPESNVVRIEVIADDPDTAVRAGTFVADDLVNQVNNTGTGDETAAALAAYTDISNQVATAQQASAAAQTAVDSAIGARIGNVPALRETAAAAAAQLAILQVQQEALGARYQSLVTTDQNTAAKLNVIQTSVVTGDDHLAQLERFGLAGVLLGAIVALLIATTLERRARRRTQARAAAGAAAAGTAATAAAAAAAAAADDVAGDAPATEPAAGHAGAHAAPPVADHAEDAEDAEDAEEETAGSAATDQQAAHGSTATAARSPELIRSVAGAGDSAG
jgi:multisubunit Na+/H+ antiporter MnhB subunit